MSLYTSQIWIATVRIGKVQELKQTTKGIDVLNISAVTDRSVKKADGTYEDVPEWHNLVIFGNKAKMLANIKPGETLNVKAKVQTRSWEGSDGVKKYTTEMVVDEVTFNGSKRAADESDAGGAPAKPASAAGGFDVDPEPF